VAIEWRPPNFQEIQLDQILFSFSLSHFFAYRLNIEKIAIDFLDEKRRYDLLIFSPRQLQ
jgi:hypothetical protein